MKDFLIAYLVCMGIVFIAVCIGVGLGTLLSGV